jgi:hypothetical protein
MEKPGAGRNYREGRGMSSVRSLTNLFCSNCNEVTMHRAERCIHCTEPNQQSGNPPVPRPERAYGYNTMKGDQYSAALQAQGDARRRARAARHQVMRGGPKL